VDEDEEALSPRRLTTRRAKAEEKKVGARKAETNDEAGTILTEMVALLVVGVCHSGRR
jgi:hypothetical protein